MVSLESRAQALRRRFTEIRAADLHRFPRRAGLLHWAISPELQEWKGIEGLARWIDHIEAVTPALDHTAWTLPVGPVERDLVASSAAFNERALSALLPAAVPRHANLDFYNMTDWVLLHAYPRPLTDRLDRVLDFGAGFGRQAALWLSRQPSALYAAIDSIELPYLLQALYLEAGGGTVTEYLDDPDGFLLAGTEGAFHLPGWRHDLLPDGFFDAVLCVQVLPELNETILFHTLQVIRRVLRPGGVLYIRDHASAWHPGHQQDLDGLLPGLGFELEFAPRWRDRNDVHGLPRVYRRTTGRASSRARTAARAGRALVRRAVFARGVVG